MLPEETMKLYFDHITGTWQLPGKQDRAAQRVDVPAAPAELAAWLQAHGVNPLRSESSCPKCGDRPAIAADIAESQDTGALTEWLLDQATPAQVEQIFAALGARFHELRKAAAQ